MGNDIGTGNALKATTSKGNEIDRLYDAVLRQDELIAQLTNRTHVVSSRAPESEKTAEQSIAPHISDLVYRVDSNNSKLDQIINELII